MYTICHTHWDQNEYTFESRQKSILTVHKLRLIVPEIEAQTVDNTFLVYKFQIYSKTWWPRQIMASPLDSVHWNQPKHTCHITCKNPSPHSPVNVVQKNASAIPTPVQPPNILLLVFSSSFSHDSGQAREKVIPKRTDRRETCAQLS